MNAKNFHIEEIVLEAEQTGQLDISYIMAKLDVSERTAYRILAAYRQHKKRKNKKVLTIKKENMYDPQDYASKKIQNKVIIIMAAIIGLLLFVSIAQQKDLEAGEYIHAMQEGGTR